MKLVITIDTEEDNWGVYSTNGHTQENIARIPRLQELFDEFNVKPTYLVAYSVVTDPKAAGILKEIADSDKCEIGTHCHPWNTPPFEEETNERNSMLCNLPEELQFKKISCLHNTIEKKIGIRPVSFRAGRWGYSPQVAANLLKLGYSVDTSVTAYTNWSQYHGPDFSEISPDPYLNGIKDGVSETAVHRLVELPATVGYLQTSFALCNMSNRIMAGKPWSRLKLNGLLRRACLVNKVSLSPELADAEDMIRLTKTMIKKKYLYINMFFHSTSLVAGLGPFVKKKEDEVVFFGRIRKFLDFLKQNGIESVKLSEVYPTISRMFSPKRG